MSTLSKHKQDWEDLSAVDPLWAIFTRPERKFGKWDVNEFFATGEQEVASLMEYAAQAGCPARRDRALDFGCGVGRLTRALSRHFGQCHGVDISARMIAQARELNRALPNCEFLLNEADNLAQFGADDFDLIYTRWVLQHLPNRALIKAYLAEFVRCLRPDGLLVFQLRTRLSLKARLQLGRKLYLALRALGLTERLLYHRLGLNPIKVITIAEAEVIALLESLGAHVLKVEPYTVASGDGSTFYVTKPGPSRPVQPRRQA